MSLSPRPLVPLLAAAGPGLDLSRLLPWTAPLLLVLPLLGLAVLLGGVRRRRAAAGLGLLTGLLTVFDLGLVAGALVRSSSPYRAAYQWVNVPVSAVGDQRFQGFGVDVALAVDHWALAGALAVLLVVLAGLLWHRVAERDEPGPARYQAGALLLLLCALGVVLAGDEVERLAFWMTAGVASYLLLARRWGADAPARASRVALALPFAGDLALLGAVALTYSRFGTLDLTKVAPALHSTPGVGLGSLTAIAILVLIAAAVRGCVWPFTPWQTGSLEQPASSVALVAGVWPLLAGVLILRYGPLWTAAAGPAPLLGGVGLALAAALGPLLGLLASDLRRALLLGSSGAVALGLLGLLGAGPAAPAAFTGLLAVGLGRGGALAAAGAAAAAMRTADLRQMGGAWKVLRRTALALLGAVTAAAFGVSAAAAGTPRSPLWAAFAVGLALAALALFRAQWAVAYGPLRRRRAFEPGRVREVPLAAWAAALPAAAGLAGAAAAFAGPWLAFLRGGTAVTGGPAGLIWLAPGLAGLLVAGLAIGLRKDALLARLGWLDERRQATWKVAGATFQRRLGGPGLESVQGLEDAGLPALERALEGALDGAGSRLERALAGLAGLWSARRVRR